MTEICPDFSRTEERQEGEDNEEQQVIVESKKDTKEYSGLSLVDLGLVAPPRKATIEVPTNTKGEQVKEAEQKRAAEVKITDEDEEAAPEEPSTGMHQLFVLFNFQ